MKKLLIITISITMGFLTTEKAHSHFEFDKFEASDWRKTWSRGTWSENDVSVVAINAIEKAYAECRKAETSLWCAYNDAKLYTGYQYDESRLLKVTAQFIDIQQYMFSPDVDAKSTGTYKGTFQKGVDYFNEHEKQLVKKHAFDKAMEACEKKSDFCIPRNLNNVSFNDGIISASVTLEGFKATYVPHD